MWKPRLHWQSWKANKAGASSRSLLCACLLSSNPSAFFVSAHSLENAVENSSNSLQLSRGCQRGQVHPGPSVLPTIRRLQYRQAQTETSFQQKACLQFFRGVSAGSPVCRCRVPFHFSAQLGKGFSETRSLHFACVHLSATSCFRLLFPSHIK